MAAPNQIDGLKLTWGDLAKAAKKAKSAKMVAERYKDTGEQIMARVVRTGFGTATGWGLGVLHGYTGGVSFLGVDFELWLALLTHGAGMAFKGPTSEGLHTMGDASLFFWSGMKGTVFGANVKAKHKQGEGNKELPAKNPPDASKGLTGGTAGATGTRLSDAELELLGRGQAA